MPYIETKSITSRHRIGWKSHKRLNYALHEDIGQRVWEGWVTGEILGRRMTVFDGSPNSFLFMSGILTDSLETDNFPELVPCSDSPR